ncbi:MAG TPA: hypothetical protein VFT89_07295 [Rhizobiaceae bacterium]|nr:hypothetical protein [Rhizobiaceae bacterium]
MKILILGAGKSGTSALHYCLKTSAEKHFGGSFGGKFEAKSDEEVRDGISEQCVFKILLERFSTFADRDGTLARFDKRVLIIRDPRDALISRLMWQIATRIESATNIMAVDELNDALVAKEVAPDCVSVYDLYRLAGQMMRGDIGEATYPFEGRRLAYLPYEFSRSDDLFLLRYEDFVDHNVADLQAYLGFPLTFDFEIPGKAARVFRTGTYGNWRNWFTVEDYRFFVDPEREKLLALGYEDERPEGPKSISPAEISGYLKRVSKVA